MPCLTSIEILVTGINIMQRLLSKVLRQSFSDYATAIISFANIVSITIFTNHEIYMQNERLNSCAYSAIFNCYDLSKV